MMHARVVTATIPPDRLDEAIRLWQDAVAPTVREQQGFRNARLLVQRGTGKVTSVGLWETEADLQRSVEWNQEHLARFARLFAAPPIVEHYELAGEA